MNYYFAKYLKILSVSVRLFFHFLLFNGIFFLLFQILSCFCTQIAIQYHFNVQKAYTFSMRPNIQINVISSTITFCNSFVDLFILYARRTTYDLLYEIYLKIVFDAKRIEILFRFTSALLRQMHAIQSLYKVLTYVSIISKNRQNAMISD